MRFWPAIALATTCAACAAEAPPPAVIVVDAEPGVDLTIEPDLLWFRTFGHEDLLDARAGDVLVSGRGDGFVRKVKTVEPAGDRIRVATEPATLADAVGDADVIRRLPARSGKDDSVGLHGIDLEIGDVDLQAGSKLALHVAGGHLRFAPDVDLDLAVRRGTLKRFRLEASGHLDAQLAIDARVQGPIDKYTFRKLASKKEVFLQMVGEVPVVEVVELSVGVGVGVSADAAASVRFSGSAAGDLSAGAIFAGGSWTPLSEKSIELDHQAELLDAAGDVEVDAMLFADVEVRLYDLAGPGLRLAPYVGLRHHIGDTGWQPRAGVKGFFEGAVKVPIINHGWIPYRHELFDVSRDFDPVPGTGPDAGPDVGSSPGGDAPTCDGVDASGFCAGGVAVTCAAGEVAITDCAASGSGCGADEGGTATCVDGCGDLDYQGACVDGSLRWCDGGAVYTIECDPDGPGCGWQDDSIGYNCL